MKGGCSWINSIHDDVGDDVNNDDGSDVYVDAKYDVRNVIHGMKAH
jgi:hypothetical protein